MFDPLKKFWDTGEAAITDWAANTARPAGSSSILRIPLKIVKRAIRLFNLLYTSYFVDLNLNWIWFAVSTYFLFYDRKTGESMMPPGQTENVWGFGQLLPNLLLVVPILSAIEIYYGNYITSFVD